MLQRRYRRVLSRFAGVSGPGFSGTVGGIDRPGYPHPTSTPGLRHDIPGAIEILRNKKIPDDGDPDGPRDSSQPSARNHNSDKKAGPIHRALFPICNFPW
jgi:hypothetical protein